MNKIREAIDLGGGQTCNIDGVIRALNEAGFVIVPKEPTEKMINNGTKQLIEYGNPYPDYTAYQVWVDMIAAIPK